MKHLGRYALEEDAARAYNRAAAEIYGSFACLNLLKNEAAESTGSY